MRSSLLVWVIGRNLCMHFGFGCSKAEHKMRILDVSNVKRKTPRATKTYMTCWLQLYKSVKNILCAVTYRIEVRGGISGIYERFFSLQSTWRFFVPVQRHSRGQKEDALGRNHVVNNPSVAIIVVARKCIWADSRFVDPLQNPAKQTSKWYEWKVRGYQLQNEQLCAEYWSWY